MTFGAAWAAHATKYGPHRRIFIFLSHLQYNFYLFLAKKIDEFVLIIYVHDMKNSDIHFSYQSGTQEVKHFDFHPSSMSNAKKAL